VSLARRDRAADLSLVRPYSSSTSRIPLRCYLRSFHSMAYSYSLATLRDLRRLLQQQDARLTVEQIRALLAWNETNAEERQRLHAMLAEITPPSEP
jgi:hypothetical protein